MKIKNKKIMTQLKLFYNWFWIVLFQIIVYILFTEKKTIMYENYVLSVFAQQNFSMYDIANSKSEAGLITRGTMVSVNSTSNMGAVVRTLCSTPGLTLNTKPTFLMPHWDINNKSKEKHWEKNFVYEFLCPVKSVPPLTQHS